MNRLLSSSLLCLTALAFTTASGFAAPEGETSPPKVEPRVVDPGPPPADAIVLFDGKDLSQWKSDRNGGPVKWDIQDGVAVVNRTGGISTKQEFGDCQLHIEWATPAEVKGTGQGRGNSGIFLQEPLRASGSGFLQQQDVFRRPGGRDIQAIRAAGQRLPQTRRVAGLRRHLPRPTLRRDRQPFETGEVHRPAEWGVGPGQR